MSNEWTILNSNESWASDPNLSGGAKVALFFLAHGGDPRDWCHSKKCNADMAVALAYVFVLQQTLAAQLTVAQYIQATGGGEAGSLQLMTPGEGDSVTITENVGSDVVTTEVPTSDATGWSVGDPIDAQTAAGKEPSWSTVRSRYWKNEANANPYDWSADNLARMKNGLAPKDSEGYPFELHHIDPVWNGGRNVIENLQALTRRMHAAVDRYRKLGKDKSVL